MKKDLLKIILTSVISMLVALLQAYLMHIGADPTTANVPALAGLNGFMLSFSHSITKHS